MEEIAEQYTYSNMIRCTQTNTHTNTLATIECHTDHIMDGGHREQHNKSKCKHIQTERARSSVCISQMPTTHSKMFAYKHYSIHAKNTRTSSRWSGVLSLRLLENSSPHSNVGYYNPFIVLDFAKGPEEVIQLCRCRLANILCQCTDTLPTSSYNLENTLECSIVVVVKLSITLSAAQLCFVIINYMVAR